MTPTPSATAGLAPQADSAESAPVSAWYALGVLTLVTLFAFIDRGVLVLQAEVIRKEFNLSDLQLGFLQGTGVAIFAALASYPLGWLADRFDRRVVLRWWVPVKRGWCLSFTR
jgi:MFS family permease